MDYVEFKKVFRKRDQSLYKKRTLEVVRSLYSIRNMVDRVKGNLEAEMPLAEAMTPVALLNTEALMKRKLWALTTKLRDDLKERLLDLYDELDTNKKPLPSPTKIDPGDID